MAHRCGLVAGLLAALTCQSVLAHAEPDRLEPAAGSVVDSAPAVVEIWFDEEVDPAQTVVSVFAEDGSQVDLGDTRVDLNDPNRRHVTVSLRQGLPPGTYTVRWHSVSAIDQDPADGRYVFTVAGAASPAATPARASPTVAGSPPAAATPTPPVAISQPGEDEDDDSGALTGGIIAAVLIVLLGGAGGWLWWRRRGPPVG